MQSRKASFITGAAFVLVTWCFGAVALSQGVAGGFEGFWGERFAPLSEHD